MEPAPASHVVVPQKADGASSRTQADSARLRSVRVVAAALLSAAAVVAGVVASLSLAFAALVAMNQTQGWAQGQPVTAATALGGAAAILAIGFGAGAWVALRPGR